MSALFAVFLPPNLASRFSGLLSLKPSCRQKIDPWRVWKFAGHGPVSEWRGSVQELLSSSLFSGHAATQVAVLRCGHDHSALRRMALRDALTGEAVVFEGFVSVVPGGLGIALNHDGMLCVLSR